MMLNSDASTPPVSGTSPHHGVNYVRGEEDGISPLPTPRGGGHSTSTSYWSHHISMCTIPLSVVCVLLCAVLVAAAGLSHMGLGTSNHQVIVSEGKESFASAIGLAGLTAFWKWLNEISALVIVSYRIYLLPQQFPVPNISNPMWDKPWQQEFIGVNVLHPERRFMYFDLATNSWTGQSIRGSVNTRFIGNADDVTFVVYERNLSTKPFNGLSYSPNGTVTFLFPPKLLLSQITLTPDLFKLLAPAMDPTGELIYAFATVIFDQQTYWPKGILLEMLPMESFGFSNSLEQIGRLQGYYVIFDGDGGLVSTSNPLLSNIYVPVGTPLAVCTSVFYNGTNTTKCRHSLDTIRVLWPELIAAKNALPESLTTIIKESSFIFEHDGEYFIAAFTTTKLYSQIWWAAVVTPAAPIYGAYFSNRMQALYLVVGLCIGITVVVLVLISALLWPLSTSLQAMVDALELKRERRTSQHESSPPLQQRVFLGRSLRVSISEFDEMREAVEHFTVLLMEIAKTLPPPVISAIRKKVRYQANISNSNFESEDMEAQSDELRLINADDSALSDKSSVISSSLTALSHQNNHTLHVDNALAWFEELYIQKNTADAHSADAPTILPTAAGAAVSFSEYSEVAYEQNAAKQAAETGGRPPPAKGILLSNATLFKKPPRRKSFFLGIEIDLHRSLVEFHKGKTASALIVSILQNILAVVWKWRGEVERIECSSVVASFGCYTDEPDAGEKAVCCALEIRDSIRHTSSLHRRHVVRVMTDNDDSELPTLADEVIAVRMAMDCGYFETVNFLCYDSGRNAIRRTISASTAWNGVLRLLSLSDALCESFVISADALKLIPPRILPLPPRLVDSVRFSARGGKKLALRGNVFIFSIPEAYWSTVEEEEEEAHCLATGVSLMVRGNYKEAEMIFHCFAMALRYTSLRIRRLHALAKVFADFAAGSPSQRLAAYFRTECPQFEVDQDEIRCLADLNDNGEGDKDIHTSWASSLQSSNFSPRGGVTLMTD